MKDDLTKPDSRWRKKNFFRPDQPRRRRWPWLFLLFLLAAVAAVAFKRGLLP